MAELERRGAALGSAAARTTAVAGGAAVLSMCVVLALHRQPPSWTLVLALGLGLSALLALALARLDAAVLLGFATLGVVSFEPAPPDAVFAVVIAVALVTGRFVLRVPGIVSLLVGVLLALNVLSAFVMTDAARGVTFLLITLYLATLAVWLAAYVDSTSRARLVVGAYLAGAAAVAALGTLALFADFPGAQFFEGLGYRAKGSFKDPNVFGHFLVPASLILLDELIAPRLFRGRLLKLALLAVTSLGVLFSYSRSAWVSAAVGTVVLLTVLVLRRGGTRNALGLVVLALVLSGVLVSIVALTDSIGFIEDRARLQQYDAERFAAQQTGIRLVGEYPFGIGPGQFEQVSSVSAHSTYVRALAEQGLLGLATLLALMLATFVLAARNAVEGQDTFGVGSAPLLAAWSGILVSSLVIDTLHWRHLWLVAALIWAGSMRRATRPAEAF